MLITTKYSYNFMSLKICFHGVICAYTTKGYLVTRISLDENWVKDNVSKLEAYFEECMLKEIICGRLKPSH